MSQKQQFALNHEQVFILLAGILMAGISVTSYLENETGFFVAFGVLALLAVLIPLILLPSLYIFDDEGITIFYLFLPNERYLWGKIKSIDVCYEGADSHTKFEIGGVPESNIYFYTKGKICKSLRTKRLLEKYWDGTIEGYMFEGLRNRLKQQKSQQIKAYLTDEVAAAEREVRAKIKEVLPFYEEQAKQLDLDFKTKFVYTTKSGNESRSRPKDEGYTYTLIVALSKPDEKDENKIVEVSAETVYARLGRKAFRAIVSETYEQEIRFFLSDVLEEIRTNGIETYYS